MELGIVGGTAVSHIKGNLVDLENDLRKLISFFQSEGYYFATITNLNSNTLIIYDKSYLFKLNHFNRNCSFVLLIISNTNPNCIFR